MLKKIIAFTVFLALTISVNTFNTSANSDSSSNMLSVTDASWNKTFDSLDDMCLDSDLIITGKVVSAVTELRYDMVFTKSYVQIIKKVKGSVNSDILIPVLQTGGTYGNITTPAITDAPLLKVGNTYELYLYLTDESDMYGQYYLISGGYQGVLEIDNGNKTVMSENNTLFNNKADVQVIKSNTPIYSYYWNKSSLLVYVPSYIRDNYHSNTRAGICAGVNAWSSHTDSPSTSITVSSSYADVFINMSDYGATGWNAYTTTKHNNNICYISDIKINSYNLTAYYSTKGLWQALACHEFGHTLGLEHNTSTSASIMRPKTNDYYDIDGLPKWTVPKAADINSINAKY